MWLSHLLAALIGALLGFVAGIVLCLCGISSDDARITQEQDDRWWATDEANLNQPSAGNGRH